MKFIRPKEAISADAPKIIQVDQKPSLINSKSRESYKRKPINNQGKDIFTNY